MTQITYKPVYIAPPAGQLAQIVTCQARGQVVVSGRRLGKTEQALRWLLMKAWNCPNREWENWFVLPTRKLVKAVAWKKLKRLASELIAKPYKSNVSETELRITLFNGNTIALKGAESIDDNIGSPVYAAVIDEFGATNPQAYEYIYPAMTDTQGFTLITGTPRGHNHFRKIYYEVLEGKRPGWVTYPIFKTIDSVFVKPEEIELAKSVMSLRMFRQEFEGSFENWAGVVFDEFSDENIKPLKFDPYLPTYIGCDFGWNHPTVLQWYQYDDKTGTYYQLCEVVRSQLRTETVAALIMGEEVVFSASEKFKAPCTYEQLIESGGMVISGAEAAQSRQEASGFSMYDNLKAPRYNIRMKLSAHRIVASVETVRSKIRAADGTCRFFIDPSCTRSIQDLRAYHYPEDNFGNLAGDLPEKDNVTDHTNDARRYVMNTVTPLRKEYMQDSDWRAA